MKYPLFPLQLSTALCLLAASAQALPPNVANDYQLMWSDEFHGSSLDSTKWAHELGPRKSAVNVEEAVSVADDKLTITTYTQGGEHRTGFIKTNERTAPSLGFGTAFGYYEASIRFHDSPGSWSAFWLMTATSGDPMGKPNIAGVEMDIVEHLKVNNQGVNIEEIVHSALHWDGYGDQHKNVANDSPPLGLSDGEFHKYGLLWTPNTLTFYFDDTPIWTTQAAISHRTEHIILSSEVQNNGWAGNIPAGGYGSLGSSSTKMTVDYVRVYREKPSVSGQSPFGGRPFPGTIQAENFDLGGLHVAYYDRPGSGYQGSEFGPNTVYRPADIVDLQSSNGSENGVHVTNTQKPEYLEYTVTPAKGGTYVGSVRVFNSGTGKGELIGSVDGAVIGSVLLPPTGGWDSWKSFSFTKPLVVSDVKPQVLSVEFTSNFSANLDSLKFDYLGDIHELSEAESAQLSGGAVKTGAYQASGEEVATIQNASSSVRWTGRNGFNGGLANFVFRYACLSSSTKDLYVNGAYAQTLSFPPTGDWSAYANVSGAVTVNAGKVNTIELRNGTGAFSVDYLILAKVSQTPSVKLEAENAALAGGTYAKTHYLASNGKVVDGMGYENASLTWSSIVGAGTPVTLKIRYVCAGTGSTHKSVFINGTLLASVNFPRQGSWTTYQTVTVAATLGNNANNTIMIKNNGPSDDNINILIDSLEVDP